MVTNGPNGPNGGPVVLCAPNAGGPGSIPGQGKRSHMPQLRPGTDKEINKYIFKSYLYS